MSDALWGDEDWEGRIEYDGTFPWPYNIHITRGFTQYGPEGGPFFAWTYRGARRKMSRILAKLRRHEAKVAARQAVIDGHVPGSGGAGGGRWLP